MKGIDLIIIQCIFVFFLFYPAKMLFPLGIVLVPTLWVFGMADAGISFPKGRGSRRYSQSRKRTILIVGAIWLFTVTVFALTAIAIKGKLNSSANAVADEEPKLKLLTITTSNDTPPDSNATNAPSIISAENTQHPQAETVFQPEKPTTTSADMLSAPEDTQPVNERLPQIDIPRLEGKNPLSYVITTGAFSQFRNAERWHIQLSLKGYQALILFAISSNNQKVHVVVVPGFSTISAAKAVAKKMKKDIDECSDCYIATLHKPTVSVDKLR